MSPATKEEDEDWVGTPPEGFHSRDKADPDYWRSQYQKYAIGSGRARGVHHPRGARRRHALTPPRRPRARGCGTMPAWRSSSPSACGASRSIPSRTATRCPTTSRCSPPTSRPTRRCRRSSRPRSARWPAPTAIPDPVQLGAAARAGQPLRRRPEPDRDRQRLLRHPARRRRGAARAGRRGRLRLAVVQRLPAPRRGVRRPRDHGRPRRRAAPRPRRDGRARSPPPRAWSSSATRTTRPRPRCRYADIAAFARARAAPRRADRRRGLLRVQPARRPRRDARPAAAPPQPRAAADVLQGPRPLRAARRLRAVRQRGVPAGRQRRAPAVLLQRRRAGRGDRGAQAPGRRRRRASSGRSSPAWRSSPA